MTGRWLSLLALVVACASEPRHENGGAAGAAGEAGGAGAGGRGEAGEASEAGRAGEAFEAGGAGEGGASEPQAAGGAGPSCPEAEQPAVVGTLSVPELTEASGLVASRRFAGVLYTHNDAGAGPRGYALREDGSLVATLELTGALAQDWEDIAIGPGPDSAETYLYIGDIGDNDAQRSGIVVHRALEPDLDPDATGDSIELDFVSLPLVYADGAHNAEALFVDPETADLYVITKTVFQNAAYVARAPHSTSASNVLEPVTTLVLPDPELATGGDIAADGSLILIRTYGGVFGWPRATGQSIGEALSGAPCVLPASDELQGEAIAIAADMSGYTTLGEGSGVPLYRADFR